MLKRLVLSGLALCCVAGTALAATVADVEVPDTASVGGKILPLNGAGLREIFWVDVYVGGLYVEKPSHDPGELLTETGPNRVLMHFVHDAPSKKVIKAWNEGFEDNNSGEVVKQLKPRIDAFNALFGTDLKDGDVVLLDYVPGAGTQVRINGVLKGTVPGEDFNQALLRIWLGPNPPSDNIKEGMLGTD
ncbi:MAG: chalcone isomerase family protein [Gammaproteobacteria bacterium]|jgi:hypothetical protein